MLKQYLHNALTKKYEVFFRNSEDNYSAGTNGPTQVQKTFANLQNSFQSMADTLVFDMKYDPKMNM